MSDLLTPRFLVTTDYPDSKFKVGDILSPHFFCKFIYSNCDNTGGLRLSEVKKYPAVFKELKWYEKREVSEMPTYIKSETQVVKPDWQLKEWNGHTYLRAYDTESAKLNISSFFKLNLFTPATEAEFINYQNQIQCEN